MTLRARTFQRHVPHSRCLPATTHKLAKYRSARRLGKKKYAPPFTVTKRSRLCMRVRSGSAWTVKISSPFVRFPTSGSTSPSKPPNTGLLTQVCCTNSNWRSMSAFRQRKWSPRGTPSSTRRSSGRTPYDRPRRRMRWRFAVASAVGPSGPRVSRGLERRTCEPMGHLNPWASESR